MPAVCCSMITVASRERPEKQMTSDDFELVSRTVGDPQRVDDYSIFGKKFDEVGAAEGGSVLVLLATRQAKIDPLDFECQVGDVILS